VLDGNPGWVGFSRLRPVFHAVDWTSAYILVAVAAVLDYRLLLRLERGRMQIHHEFECFLKEAKQ
jgi:hypothetical protein